MDLEALAKREKEKLAEIRELSKLNGFSFLMEQLLTDRSGIYARLRKLKPDDTALTAAEFVGYGKAIEKINSLMLEPEEN